MKKLLLIARLCATACMLLSTLVLLGWYIHVPALIQIHPSFAPMQYNTALGFLCSGLTLCATLLHRKKWAVGFASATFVLGILSLSQYLFSINLGIDQLFMDAYIFTKTSHPGRMAPNTAFCFSLTGLTFMVYHINPKYKLVSKFLGLSVLIQGLIALIGYLVSIEAAYGWQDLTRMAIHTSFGFVTIGIGAEAFFWKDRLTSENKKTKIWVSIFTSTLVFFIVLALWEQLNIDYARTEKRTTTNKTVYLGQVVQQDMDNIHNALKRMAKRWITTQGISEQEWTADAKNYLHDYHQLNALYILDRNANVLHHENKNLSYIPNIKEISLTSLPSNHSNSEPEITGYITYDNQGAEQYIRITIPLYYNQAYQGYLVAYCDLTYILDTLLKDMALYDYHITINDQDYTLFEKRSLSKELDTLSHTTPLPIFNQTWTFRLAPLESRAFGLAIPYIILLGGSFLSILLGFLVYSIFVYYEQNTLLNKKSLELIAHQNQLKSVLEVAPDGILSVDKKGIILMVNQAITNIFGHTEAELLGQNINILIPQKHHHHHHKDVADYAKKGNAKTMAQGREVNGVRKDGSFVPLEIGLNSKTLPDGTVQIVAAVQDITLRRQQEQQREELISKLTDSNEELERFAYICSHDLQEPLRMVRSFTEKLHTLLQIDDNEKAKTYFNFILDGAERAQLLIADILTYSRLELDTVKPEKIDIAKLIHNIASSYDTASISITTHNIMPIFGNKTQIYQVFQNLINNGIKYQAPDASPHIQISMTDTDTHWEISIQDNGIGIAEKYIDQIFEVFKRLHRKDEYPGTGIGLSICKKVVERHGGSIRVKSTPGKGSTFYFTILKPNSTKDT